MYNYNNTAGNENCNKDLDLPLIAKCTKPELLSTFLCPLSISSVLVISKREPWTDVGSCCSNHASLMLKDSGRGNPIMVKVEVYWYIQLVYLSSSALFILVVIFLVHNCKLILCWFFFFFFLSPLFLLCASLFYLLFYQTKLPHQYQFSFFSPLISCCGQCRLLILIYIHTATPLSLFPFFPFLSLPLWGSSLLPSSHTSLISHRCPSPLWCWVGFLCFLFTP